MKNTKTNPTTRRAAAETDPTTALAAALAEIDHHLNHPRRRPRPIDVRHVRRCVGMTQKQFAHRFGFSVATLRHWERGDRRPRGPALVLLNVIARNPKAVTSALDAVARGE